VQAVAAALDIHPFMLSRWRKEARVSGGPPTDEESSRGFTFVWQVHRTEGLIEAYSLTSDSSVLCERCGARFATAVFRNGRADPPAKVLLCGECLDVENGRKLVDVLNEAAVPPPFPEKMSDDQLRDLFRNFRIAPPDDVQ
jgi:transposase-like protein